MESWAAALFGGGGVGPGGGEMLAGVVGRPPRPRGRRGDCGFGSLVGGHPGDLLSRSEGGGLLHAVLTPQAPIPADLAPRGVGVGALSGISLWPAVAATTSATYVTPSSSLGATSRGSSSASRRYDALRTRARRQGPSSEVEMDDTSLMSCQGLTKAGAFFGVGSIFTASYPFFQPCQWSMASKPKLYFLFIFYLLVA